MTFGRVGGEVAAADHDAWGVCTPNAGSGASSVHRFNEVEGGDLILGFAGDAPLPEVGGQNSEVRDLMFVVSRAKNQAR